MFPSGSGVSCVFQVSNGMFENFFLKIFSTPGVHQRVAKAISKMTQRQSAADKLPGNRLEFRFNEKISISLAEVGPGHRIDVWSQRLLAFVPLVLMSTQFLLNVDALLLLHPSTPPNVFKMRAAKDECRHRQGVPRQ